MLLQLGLLVLLTTVVCELAAKRGWIPYWVSRKILHVVAVGSCAVAGYYADALGHRAVLTWIVAGAEVALLALVTVGGLMREESGRRAWGIVWFPLAFLVLLVTTESAEVIGLCMAILAVCDPAATITGKLVNGAKRRPGAREKSILDDGLVGVSDPEARIENRAAGPGRNWRWYLSRSYQLTGDPKTLVGSAAFFVSAFLLTACFVSYDIGARNDLHLPLNLLLDGEILLYLFTYGLLLTVAEALGSKGADNLYVPLMAIVALEFNVYNAARIHEVWITLPLAVIFCGVTYYRKSLSAGGALTAAVLGIIISFTAEPIWLVPLFVFFFSSSMIGKIYPSEAAAGEAKHNLPRDATQVMANGAVYTALVFLANYRPGHLYAVDLILNWKALLLSAAAVATADTWSSEIGQYFRRPTWDLLKLRRVPPGLSGGVSFPGTLAGLAGSALIAVLGWVLPLEFSWPQFALITAIGFAGMLLDSVLGSLLQAKYRDPETGALSDTQPEGGALAAGFPWMTNDLVNFLAILLTVGVTGLIMA